MVISEDKSPIADAIVELHFADESSSKVNYFELIKL